MNRSQPHKVPALKLYKGTGQAYVLLDGHRRYLGRADAPDAREWYLRAVAQWIARGRRARAPEDITIVEVTATCETIVDRLTAALRSERTQIHRESDGLAPV